MNIDRHELDKWRIGIIVVSILAIVLALSFIMIHDETSSASDDTVSEDWSDAMGIVYEFDEKEKTAKDTDYRGSDKDPVIPSTVVKGGIEYRVTYIGKAVITEEDGPISLVIPDSVDPMGHPTMT